VTLVLHCCDTVVPVVTRSALVLHVRYTVVTLVLGKSASARRRERKKKTGTAVRTKFEFTISNMNSQRCTKNLIFLCFPIASSPGMVGSPSYSAMVGKSGNTTVAPLQHHCSTTVTLLPQHCDATTATIYNRRNTTYNTFTIHYHCRCNKWFWHTAFDGHVPEHRCGCSDDDLPEPWVRPPLHT
jgi:hypothetical protein